VTASRLGAAPVADQAPITASAFVAAPANGTVPSTVSADLGALTAVSAAIALVVTYVLAVRTATGQLIDTHAMAFVARSLDGAAWASKLLSAISPTSVLLAIASLALTAWASRGAAAAVAATTTTAGTILATIALKAALVRPILIDQSANSLPSGHVAAVAGLAAAATFVAQPRWRQPIALGGLAGVLLTGLATMVLQWHRPSDVVAAALLAMTLATTVDAIFRRLRRRVARRRERSQRANTISWTAMGRIRNV
jgi:membrane-associated phospholipid phosphatase